jgi:hypothetical protein
VRSRGDEFSALVRLYPWAYQLVILFRDSEWTVNYDGKDRPQTGHADADTLSLKRIDAFTAEFTQKRPGKVVMTGRRTLSRDGKVMTLTTKGTNARGRTVNNVEIFEKR